MRALKTVAILAVLLMLVGTGIAPVEAQGVPAPINWGPATY